MESTSKNLLYVIENLLVGALRTATGHGVDAYPIAVQSILNGGHARIGLEDCIQLSSGQLVESNARLGGKLVRIGHERSLDLDIAAPKEARDLLKVTYRSYDEV